jgi:hypothetical protein
MFRNPVTQPQEDRNKLPLGPAPLDEEWIPKVAVFVLVDLMSVVCSRPKGMFKDCTSRISSGLERVNGMNLRITTRNSILLAWATCLRTLNSVLRIDKI